MRGRYLLTDRQCQKAKGHTNSAYLLPDGGSLYLRVRPSGGKAWTWRYRERQERGGRVREMGLGAYPEVSLADARKKADELRRQHRDGTDVLGARRDEQRRQRGIPTFGEATAEYIEWRTRLPGKNKLEGSSLVEWETTLRLHAAKLNTIRVDCIVPEDVTDALKEVWVTNRSAQRILNRVEQILDRCVALRYCTSNPAGWNIQQHLLGYGHKNGDSHRAMRWQELPAFMERLRAEPGERARALEFIILTASRSGEVVGDQVRGKPSMSVAEIEGDLWVVPAERMKRGVEHRVPLSDRALEIAGEAAGTRKSHPGLFRLAIPQTRR